jgi:hypothetical protein
MDATGEHTSGNESGPRGREAAKFGHPCGKSARCRFCTFGRRSILPSSKHDRDLPAFTSEDDARANFGKLLG